MTALSLPWVQILFRAIRDARRLSCKFQNLANCTKTGQGINLTPVKAAFFVCPGKQAIAANGGNSASPLRNIARCKEIPGGSLGEKIPPNFLSIHVFADCLGVAGPSNVHPGNLL